MWPYGSLGERPSSYQCPTLDHEIQAINKCDQGMINALKEDLIGIQWGLTKLLLWLLWQVCISYFVYVSKNIYADLE